MTRASAAAAFLLTCACSVDVGSLADGGGAADTGPGAADSAIAPASDAGLSADAGEAPDAAGGTDAAAGRDAAGAPPDAGPLDPKPVTVSYPLDPATNFANPERGLYHHEETSSPGYSALDAAALARYRTQESISLVLRIWYVPGFVAQDFDQAFLTAVATDFERVRAAGLKAVVRFAYSKSETAADRDATKAQVLRHVAQLRPILEANAGVLATVQAGFVGVWGEWYYTDHFGDEGTISAAQWADRQEVVEALLAAASGRAVLLRTPLFKTTMYGAAPLTSTEAFTGSERARVGHHNDCFLASADDYGTYRDVAADKAYLAQETLYVPIGGETCATSAYSGWANANAEMSSLHWSFLNADYHAAVLSSWGANLEVAKRSLGYRLALVEGTFPSVAAAGGRLDLSLTLRNDGYAAPFNPRGLSLVLREVATAAEHVVPLAGDPRRWAPGANAQLAQSVELAGVPAGSYDLLLHLPDPSPSLAARPEYAIRLANDGTWEAATGYNDLGHRVTVVP